MYNKRVYTKHQHIHIVQGLKQDTKLNFKAVNEM